MLAEVVRRPLPQAAEPRAVHRVLLAFDGSPGAWSALDQAIAIADAQHALLTIAAVVPEPCVWVGLGPVGMPFTREMLQRDLERDMQQKLAAARDEVPATISVTTRLLHGRAARRLAELADSGDYDLVVAGPRRSGPVRRLLGHSVTHSLLTRCRTSVLAVKGVQPHAEVPYAGVRLTVTHELEQAPKLAAMLAGESEDSGAGGGWAWVLSDLKSLLETGDRIATS